MGKSAKMMKRPTKQEKVARQVNQPTRPSTIRSRSISPDTGPSEIPLFNTSAKGRQTGGGHHRNITRGNLDSDQIGEPESTPTTRTNKSTTTPRDRMRAARDQLEQSSNRTDHKLGATHSSGSSASRKPSAHAKGGKDKFQLGVDYVKLHESRPGGLFKKKLR